MEKLLELLVEHKNLIHINLAYCYLNDEDIMQIFEAIAHNPNLLSIHLTGNKYPFYENIEKALNAEYWKNHYAYNYNRLMDERFYLKNEDFVGKIR